MISRILLCMLLAFALNGKAQQTTVTFNGQVTHADTGEELEGVVVELHELHQFAVTNADGAFSFKQIRPGFYHVHFTLMGFKPAEKTVDLRQPVTDFAQALSPTAIHLQEVKVEEDLLRSGLKDRPLSIAVVDKDQLTSGYTDNLATTLSLVPGITSINTGTGIGKPVIRGLSFNRVMVNQNGIKQGGQQWGTDHGLEIDQYAVDRVEVIKGPASLVYGSDAMAGVINILPERPLTENGLHTSFTSFYRSINQLYGASLQVGTSMGNQFIQGRYTVQDFGDYRVPASAFVYNTYELPITNELLKNTAGKERSFTITGGTGGGWGNVRLTISNFNQQAGLFAGAIGIPRSYRLTDDGDRRNIDIPYQYTNHFRTDFNGKWLVKKGWIHADMGYQHNLRQEWSYPHIHGLGPAPTDDLALEMQLATYTANIRYYQLPRPDLKLIYGWSGQYKENTIGGFEFLVPAYTAFQTGIYGFAEWKSSITTTWSGGLRYDLGTIDQAGYQQPLYDADTNIIGYRERSAPLQQLFQNISGSAGVSYRPSDRWNIRANLGKSFRMPNGAELGMNGVHHGTFRHEMGDTSLTSEDGYQLDVGLSYASKHLVISFSPYFNYFHQFIFLRPTGSFSLLPDAGQIYQYTQANAIHTGWESHIDWHPVAPLHLELSTAYTWNLNLETSLPLPFTPPLNVRPSVSYEWESEKKTLSSMHMQVLYNYFAAQNRTDRNEPATPGYGLFDVQIGLQLGKAKTPLTLLLAVRNIFDKAYLNHLSRYRILNVPEPGRNFVVTLQYQPKWLAKP